MKECRVCKIVKNIEEFSMSKESKDGLQRMCIKCRSEYYFKNKERTNAKNNEWYAKNKEKRLKKGIEHYNNNKWMYHNYSIKRKRAKFNSLSFLRVETIKKQLKEIYQNAPKGYDVDHIIPLNHSDVCGLHVPWNLQYITEAQNAAKSNKFDANNPTKYDFTNKPQNAIIKQILKMEPK